MKVPKYEVYRAKGKGPQVWRWRLKAANGLTIADGSEAYASESNARRAVRRAKFLSMIAVVTRLA